jgi:hypothetical protein
LSFAPVMFKIRAWAEEGGEVRLCKGVVAHALTLLCNGPAAGRLRARSNSAGTLSILLPLDLKLKQNIVMLLQKLDIHIAPVDA